MKRYSCSQQSSLKFFQRYICVICLCMFNRKMNFASHENEVMKEEINDQHEEMCDQKMSDEDHALSGVVFRQ